MVAAMATIRVTETDLRAAMRDRRYWQPGHPERAAFGDWVTEGWQRLHGPDAATEGGERVVQVRAHDRTRNGRREHVDGYAQRRRGRGGADDTGTRQAPPRAAPEPAPAPQRPTLVIFVGGLFDGTSRIVGNTRADMQESMRGSRLPVTVEYASHDQASRLRSLITGAAAGTRIVLVGHSWGADTAAQTVARPGQEGRLVDQLVTIDPVGRFVSDDYFRRVRAGTLEWINVNAADGDPRNPGNQIAQVGGSYGTAPARFASQHIDAPFAHGDFAAMPRGIAPGGWNGVYQRLLGR
jgi:hypothetical protein